MIPVCLFAQYEYYNPINVGNYWIQHTDSAGGFTSRTDIEGIDLIGGKEYFRMKQELTKDNSSQEPNIWYVWVGQDSTGGLLGGFGNSSDLDSATIYDPPVLSFPNDADTLGSTWEYDMPGTGEGGQHFKCTIESFSETVEVPTGTYNNCFKMSTIITNTSGDTTQIYDLYYAGGVGQVLNEGWSAWWGNYSFELIEYYIVIPVDAEQLLQSSLTFSLHQNYPNPFNSETIISYQLPRSGSVILSIYNLAGQLVETLVNGYKDAGYHSAEWNAGNIVSGVYFYKINTGDYTATRKCLMIK